MPICNHRELRTIPELLSRTAAGWRFEWCQPHEVDQAHGWHQYWLVDPKGGIWPVRASVAVVAWRKGLAKPRARDTEAV